MENKGKRILVVDDSPTQLEEIKLRLEDHHYEVAIANSGAAALKLLEQFKPDLVVSDIVMEQMTGVQLLEQIQKKSSVPVILMTGFASLMETQKAHDLGAADFLVKPIAPADLYSAIDKGLRRIAQPDLVEEVDPSSYCRVSIEDFISGSKIEYDIFIRLGAVKYVKILHKGSIVDADRIRIYKGKGVHYLFLTIEDFRKYLGLTLQLAEVVKSNPGIDKPRKLQFMKNTSDLILDHSFVNGVNEESFHQAKAVVDATVSMLTNDGEALHLLESLNSNTDFQYAHSLGVSLYATMIAEKMGWRSSAINYKLTMAGLFHDIGKKDMPRELVAKPRSQLNPQELAIYQMHPSNAMEALGQVQSAHEEVVKIIYHHHENCLGKGFPQGLTKEFIHPLARLIAVADEFCNLVLVTPGSAKMEPRKALQLMEEMFKGGILDNTYRMPLRSIFIQEDGASR